jgi:hypothetical protein
MVDMTGRKYTVCRGWPRGEVTNCVTFYVLYTKDTFFSIVHFDLLRKRRVSSGEDAETNGRGEEQTQGG